MFNVSIYSCDVSLLFFVRLHRRHEPYHTLTDTFYSEETNKHLLLWLERRKTTYSNKNATLVAGDVIAVLHIV
jgi:hypothetical protein